MVAFGFAFPGLEPGAVLKVLTFVVLVVLAIVFFILNHRGWKAEAAMNKMQEKDDEKDNF